MEETGNENVVAFSTDKSKKKNDKVFRARQKFPHNPLTHKKTSSICKKAGMIFFYLTVHMLNIQ